MKGANKFKERRKERRKRGGPRKKGGVAPRYPALARTLLYPVKKAERNFEIAARTLCLRVRRYASLYSSGTNPASQATFQF